MGRRMLVFLAAAACVVALVTPVQATNFGIPFADNSYHRYNYDPSIQARWRDSAERSRVNSYGATSMSSVVECCHTDTVDIWLHSQPVPNADGEYNCLYFTNILQNACDHAHIKFETGARNNGTAWTDTYQVGLACHEIGHSVGLRHGVGDSTYQCMTSTPATKFLGAHNVAHINSYYSVSDTRRE
jgi:hypothetical protein